MCTTCGCSDGEGFRLVAAQEPRASLLRPSLIRSRPNHRPQIGATPHPSVHTPAPVDAGNGLASERGAHGTHAPHGAGGGRRGADSVMLEQAVLAKNDQIAGRNRAWLQRRGVLALNVVSSPGAGKTTLLERTLTDLNGVPTISVIEGDQETQRDAERVRATGCLAVQINTGAGCHLDAEMVAAGMESLAPPDGSIVVIENVGNLVCPALFDLGEHARIVVLSVTEGDDKPLKYPNMFRSAHLLLLNKVDLLPYVNFSVERAIGYARRINPSVDVLQVSATTGEGMGTWYEWLRQRLADARQIGIAS